MVQGLTRCGGDAQWEALGYLMGGLGFFALLGFAASLNNRAEKSPFVRAHERRRRLCRSTCAQQASGLQKGPAAQVPKELPPVTWEIYKTALTRT